MKEISSPSQRRVLVGQVHSAAEPVDSFAGEVYVCVLWATENGFSQAERRELATRLMQSGCRYLVCGGIDCEQWHDEADLAWVCLGLDAPAAIPTVMTTWHTGETEEEVISFAFNDTGFGGDAFTRFLVLVIGQDQARLNRIEWLVAAAVSRA